MTGEYLERYKWRKFDSTLLFIVLLLSAIGVIAIYSSNLQSDSMFMKSLYLRQIYWISLSLVAMGVVMFIDYHTIERMAYPLYTVGIISLILVDITGHTGGGSQRWLAMGGFNFQPSEIMKITLIILIARIVDDMEKDEEMGVLDLLKPAFFAAVPFLMVARQPDLGTALIFIILFASIVLFAGIRKRIIVKTAALMAILAPLFWLFLKPYQKKRILTLLDPESDPMGQGYQIIQSKIAIGSGGLWGKGLFEGTQSKLNFLPAKHTDFIFSVVAEEVGFVGSIILIALFFFFIMRVMETAIHSRDKFGALITVGVGSMITFNLLYNIGMTLGLLPIVGLTAPFISYGGSSLLTNFIGIGLVLNVSYRRFASE